MLDLGQYTVDTLQIYFPWDDDLYTYFKNKGLGTKNTKKKALPLIYTDNCMSTTGVAALKRKFVLHPNYFGRTIKELGWTETEKENEPIIPAEKPQVKVSLLDKRTSESEIEFKIIPTVDNKEQYHIEYSAMSAFGKMYTNWSIIYLTINDFRDLVSKINQTIEHKPKAFVDFPILTL
ncbi:MAG: hypothetical protein QMC80_08125 [Thermoplasmatales archaeon]|nr:hypothetical protein [Thermoplasmatales archaeon]